jgi:hypothetical protein
MAGVAGRRLAAAARGQIVRRRHDRPTRRRRDPLGRRQRRARHRQAAVFATRRPDGALPRWSRRRAPPSTGRPRGAALGNADNADGAWGYAGCSSSRVLRVSAIARDAVPNYSNRDCRHNDIARLRARRSSRPTEGPHLRREVDCQPGYSVRPVGSGEGVVLGSASRGAAVLFAVEPSAADQIATPTRSAADADGHGMPSLLDRPRRAHRLGPARRRKRGPQAGRLTARFGPVQANDGRRSPPPPGATRTRIRATRTTGTSRTMSARSAAAGRRRFARLRRPIRRTRTSFSGSPALADRRQVGDRSYSQRSRSRLARSSRIG